MRKKFTYISLIALIGIIFFLFQIFNNHLPDERSEYEKFLVEESKNLGSLTTDKGSEDMPDHPELAALQNYFMTIDPELKRVPNDRLLEAYNYTKDLQAENEYKSTKTSLDWIETGSNMGGRTRSLMWDPNDPEGTKVWAGAVTGGLWYNNDIYNNNSSWVAVDDYWPSLSISSIVYDPNDPITFYVGTGEYQTARVIYRESSGVGIGIWKSTDGGNTWEIIPSTEDFKYISDLKVRDENGTSVIYAGVVSGTYHGINHQSEPSDGLYRSVNGGETWEQILPNIIGEDLPYAPADLEIGPTGRLFVGTMKNLDGDGGAAILYSDNGTSGSWTIFDDYEAIIQNDPEFYIPGRVIIATAPSDPNRIYALVGAGWYNSAGFNYARGRYILRSNDGGDTWNPTNLPGGDPDWASLSWHAFIAVVNPTNPDDLFVGGLDVWKSNNGGNNWLHISDWSLMYWSGGDDYVHADQHVQLYKEDGSNEMLLGTDGGVFYTADASYSDPVFQEKNRNYSTLQFYTCDIYPVPNQNYFVGGLQDNGTLLYMGDPLDIDDMIDGADGAFCFFDENEPNILITSIYYNSYTIFLNWDYYTDMGSYGTGVFINPVDYDSENNILFANGVTFNGSNPNRILRISGIPNSNYDQLVSMNTGLSTYFSCVKVSPFAPANSSTIFLGSQNGRLFKAESAQATPDVVEIGPNEFPTAYISSIAIGGSEDTLLVTFSNYGIQSVWQTYDGGENWTDISGNLPDMPIRWAIYHPQNSQQVMLATEIGVWTTKYAGAEIVEWEPDAVMPNVRVDMLQMRALDNTVLAATHGRGLIYATWDYDPATSVTENTIEEISVYPNPSNGIFNLKSSEILDGTISITDLNGKILQHYNVSEVNTQIDLSDQPKGTYLLRYFDGKLEFSQKIMIR